ncbi:MAG: hypothetical protein AVDCRST_MAG20-58, partial [uncultured Acidimicrobiales bacterium]
ERLRGRRLRVHPGRPRGLRPARPAPGQGPAGSGVGGLRRPRARRSGTV